MTNRKRRVCVVVASRANYARIKYFLKAVQASEQLELQLIVGASALLYKFGRVVDVMKADGFEPNWKIYYLVEGENLATQAKSTGMGIIELSTAFQETRPDVVVTVADRYETMATAIAATYLNIPLAHVQGGEVSGSIDDSVRHAVTKMSHLHYPSTKLSADRIISMGEEPWRVVCAGCPSIDILAHSDLRPPPADYFADCGVGKPFDPSQPFVLMVQHPETTSYGHGAEQIMETLSAMKDISINKLVLWPNPDAGSDDVAKALRGFHSDHPQLPISYQINFPPEIFAALLASASCLVGNSSAFIREGSFLGTPAVIVGDRQEGREHGANVVFAPYERNAIREQVLAQMKHGRYHRETRFGDGQAGRNIAEHLATARLEIRKRHAR